MKTEKEIKQKIETFEEERGDNTFKTEVERIEFKIKTLNWVLNNETQKK